MNFKVEKVFPDSEINQLLYHITTTPLITGYVEIGDEKVIMPESYVNILEEIDNFEVNDSDVFIMTYPKTGTTWVQEMIWLVLNEANCTSAANLYMIMKAPFLEMKGLFDFRGISNTHPDFIAPKLVEESINLAKNYEGSPRLIKTHLPWCLLPKQIRDGSKKPKIIYTSRNVKDTCISYYHHDQLMAGGTETLDEFCELFLENKLMYGSFWNHVLPMWEKRNDSNVLFIFYEEMKTDLPAVIKKAAAFLDKSLTQPQIDDMVEHLSFETMKKNHKSIVSWVTQFFITKPKGGAFMRRGIVGSYKDEMRPEMAKKFDAWTEAQIKGTELFEIFKKFNYYTAQ